MSDRDGARARFARVTAGVGLEWVRLDVARASTSGEVRGTGLGVRLLAAVDLIRLGGEASVAAIVDATLDTFDPLRSPDYVPALHAGAGLHW